MDRTFSDLNTVHAFPKIQLRLNKWLMWGTVHLCAAWRMEGTIGRQFKYTQEYHMRIYYEFGLTVMIDIFLDFAHRPIF
jgi:hypothetical protein